MTKGEGKSEVIDLKGLLGRDEDFVRAAVEALVQAALEAEMSEAIGAEKGERSETRVSCRSGYYSRSLITRVGTLELRVPQDRMGRFFDRAIRALPTLGEGAGRHPGGDVRARGFDAQEPAPAKAGVKAVTEALCGHSFSASSISAINKSLDAGLGSSSARRCWWRWRSTRMAGVRSWRSSWPIARAGRAGVISSRGSGRAASPVSSLSSPTIMRG